MLHRERNEAKKLSKVHYFTGRPCVHGHITKRWTVNARCMGCHGVTLKNIPPTSTDQRNKRTKERAKIWYKNNKQKTFDRAKVWKSENKEAVKKSCRKWRKKDTSKAICFMHGSLRRVLKTEKNGRTEKLLGYTRLELVTHLEKQFLKGMTWANHGDWHIDHITPVSRLLSDGETDPKKINALSNLQPLWAEDNLKKNNKITRLL